MMEDDGRRRPHTASVIVNVGEKATFDVLFCPTVPQRSQAQIKLSVIDNQYEDSIIALVGEGYEDDVTLDNIHSVVQTLDPEQEEGSMADDDVPGKNHQFSLTSINYHLLSKDAKYCGNCKIRTTKFSVLCYLKGGIRPAFVTTCPELRIILEGGLILSRIVYLSRFCFQPVKGLAHIYSYNWFTCGSFCHTDGLQVILVFMSLGYILL